MAGIIGALTTGMGLAKLILERSNTKESRKYVDAYVAAELSALEAQKQVDLEKAKPQEEQFDNIVEHFETVVENLKKTAEIMENAAEKELIRMLGSN